MQTRKRRTLPDDPRDPKKLSKILSRNSLGDIVEKAYFLLSLQEALYRCLPAGISAENCRVANLHEKVLVIDTPHAHFGTRLRFQQEEIIEKLNWILGSSEIEKLNVRIRQFGV